MPAFQAKALELSICAPLLIAPLLELELLACISPHKDIKASPMIQIDQDHLNLRSCRYCSVRIEWLMLISPGSLDRQGYCAILFVS